MNGGGNTSLKQVGHMLSFSKRLASLGYSGVEGKNTCLGNKGYGNDTVNLIPSPGSKLQMF